LPAGASATTTLEYENPLNEPIAPVKRVLGGTGAR